MLQITTEMSMYAVFLNHMLFINVRKFSGVVKILVQYQLYGKFHIIVKFCVGKILNLQCRILDLFLHRTSYEE